MVSQVINALRSTITSPRKDAGNKFIKWCLQNFVNQDNLRHAIEDEVDIVMLALNHFGLGHSSITPVFKVAMKIYWSELEKYLTDAERLRDTLSKSPGCRQLLTTPQGISYLNRCCEQAYNVLYDVVWLNRRVP